MDGGPVAAGLNALATSTTAAQAETQSQLTELQVRTPFIRARLMNVLAGVDSTPSSSIFRACPRVDHDQQPMTTINKPRPQDIAFPYTSVVHTNCM